MAATANIKIVGTSSLVGADVSADKALYVESRPPALLGGGAYSVAASTGSMGYASMSGLISFFAFRWTHPTRLCLIQRVMVGAVVDGAVTTPTSFQLCMVLIRNYMSNASGGTQIDVTAAQHNQKLRTSFLPSAMQAASIWVATTGALTDGTGVRDGNSPAITLTEPVGWISGMSGQAVGDYCFGRYPGLFPMFDASAPGAHPLVLSRHEGFTIDEPGGSTPTDGTVTMVFQVEWQEVASY